MILQLEPSQYELSEMPAKMLHIESVFVSSEKNAEPFINVWRRDPQGWVSISTYKQTTKHGNTTLRLARARRIQDALDAQSELPY